MSVWRDAEAMDRATAIDEQARFIGIRLQLAFRVGNSRCPSRPSGRSWSEWLPAGTRPPPAATPSSCAAFQDPAPTNDDLNAALSEAFPPV